MIPASTLARHLRTHASNRQSAGCHVILNQVKDVILVGVTAEAAVARKHYAGSVV